MSYFGGKHRLGKRLAEVISEFEFGTYWEPFCGMFSVGKYLQASRIASDAQPDLIHLLRAVRDGWEPPHQVSEDMYNALKNIEPCALRGFVGFECSYAGKFFGGYARNRTNRNYATNAVNSLGKLRPMIQDVKFRSGNYCDLDLSADLIYCDPPYKNTTGYTVGNFDHSIFWQWVRDKSKQSIVLVSEYSAPGDFETIWSQQIRTDMSNSKGVKIPRVERLFKMS